MSSLLSPYSLIPVTPDYDNIQDALTQLVTDAAQTPSAGSWQELIKTSTGQFLVRFISSVAADAAWALERAQHEIHPDTARRPSSIYTMTRGMGVHIQRKSPASVQVSLTRSTDVDTTILVIPAYTQFQVGGVNFFNRDAITFALGVDTLTFNIYQGTFVSTVVASTGKPFQQFVFGPADFSVSDVDLFATVGDTNTEWQRVVRGLWEYGPNDKIFFENTAPNGQVHVWFGDGITGALLPAGQVTFNYIVVDKDDATLAMLPTDSQVTVTGYPNLLGSLLETPSGTLDVRDIEYYRLMAPHLADASVITTTRANYRAACLEYPGVIDAVVRGQAEINPSDLRWMNGLAITLLTATEWSAVDFALFTNYLHSRGNSTLHVYNWPAKQNPIDVELVIRVVNRASLSAVENQARTLITGLFGKQFGALGRMISLDTFAYTLRKNITDPYGALVTSCDVISPHTNIVQQMDHYAVLSSLKLSVVYDPNLQTKTVSGVTVPLQMRPTVGV